MFSAKNYGLPKDLIEAAKRVHEKQLEEQEVPTVKAIGPYKERPEPKQNRLTQFSSAGLLKRNQQPPLPKQNPKRTPRFTYDSIDFPPGTPPETKRKARKRLEKGFVGFADTFGSTMQNLPRFGTKSEEVQFTEEELAEAFAIFLEAKNYGPPKDLIEAAKRVHEKQLEEQQVPKVRALEGSPRIPPSKASKEIRNKADENERNAQIKLRDKELGDLSKRLKDERKNRKHLTYISSRYDDTKSEEVQFTEEELAEAFAIFLEENFHVDMLTEEDLDYIFENEFPQWLEEGLSIVYPTPEEQAKREKERREREKERRKRDDEEAKKNEKIPMV